MAATDPVAALAVVHEALDTDPAGKETLLTCADWFYDHQCWADAADAYAGYLHIETTLVSELRHAESLIGAGHLDEAGAELERVRAGGLTESDREVVLGLLAWTFALKGDPGQGLAFANEAGLQRHALSSSAQRCLMMRSTCRFLLGQKAKGIEDMERLYAMSSSAEVLEQKTQMQNGTFHLEIPKAYPEWYPPKVEVREGPVVEQVPDGHAEELAIGAASPDGHWRWSGSQWEAIISPDISLPTTVAPSPAQSTLDEQPVVRP